MADFNALRSLFPAARKLCYLNSAGVAPISRPVADAMVKATRECLSYGASRYAEKLYAEILGARSEAAALLSCATEDIALVKNTSEGISTVALGLEWRRGDKVVVPEGEFPANLYPWMNLAGKGVEVVRVPMKNGRLSGEGFKNALSQKGVRLLAVSAVEYGSGFRNDIEFLGQLCASKGIFFFVDAIQMLGWKELKPRDYSIDALAADGHKWICGPEGAGILYVSEKARGMVAPSLIGWNNVKNPLDFSSEAFIFKDDAGRYESGSFPVVPVAGLGASLKLLNGAGVEKIEKRVLALSDYAAEGLLKRDFRLFSSRREGEKSPIVSFFPRNGVKPGVLQAALLKRGVLTAARGDALRISPHFFNNEADLDFFFDILDEFQGGDS